MPEHVTSKCTISRGTKMVAGKHTTWQQEILFSVTKTGLATEKCFSKGFQSIMLSIMMWMKEEQKLHINVLKLLAVKLALLTITKGETLHSQIHSKTELSENWRNWQLYIDKGQQRDLGNFNVQRDHSYRTVLAKFSVSERGLAVQAQYLLEWQLSTQIFNKVNQVLGQRRKHLFTSRQLNLMKTGSTKKKEKCNVTGLAISGKSPNVCIFLVFPYPSITGKGCPQQNSEPGTDYASLAHSTMVPRNIRFSHIFSDLIEKKAMRHINPRRKGLSLLANNSLTLLARKMHTAISLITNA